MAGITENDLAKEIAEGLLEYSEKVTEITKAAVDKVAKKAAEELKSSSPKKTGAYAKDWTNKNAFENQRSKRKTVYNKEHYQLTHLLENGHAKRGGGRVPGKPHIKAVEEMAKVELEEEIRKALG